MRLIQKMIVLWPVRGFVQNEFRWCIHGCIRQAKLNGCIISLKGMQLNIELTVSIKQTPRTKNTLRMLACKRGQNT